MSLPTEVGVGTPSGTAGDATPTTHASTVAGDDLWLAVEANLNQAPATITGYTLVDGSTGASAGSTSLTVWHRKATATAADNPTIADVGNHLYAVILTTRGGHATTPVKDSNNDREEVADTSGSSPGVDTTGTPDCLVLDFVSTNLDSTTPTWSGWANSDLANLRELFEGGTDAGGGGGIAIHAGDKATAGTVGPTTVTTPNDHKAFVKIAVAPAATSTVEDTVTQTATVALALGEALSQADALAATAALAVAEALGQDASLAAAAQHTLAEALAETSGMATAATPSALEVLAEASRVDVVVVLGITDTTSGGNEVSDSPQLVAVASPSIEERLLEQASLVAAATPTVAGEALSEGAVLASSAALAVAEALAGTSTLEAAVLAQIAGESLAEASTLTVEVVLSASSPAPIGQTGSGTIASRSGSVAVGSEQATTVVGRPAGSAEVGP